MGYFKKVKSFSDLKRQYRKLLRKWHPDNDGDEEEVMKEINAEFDTLYVIWKDTQESEKGIVIKQTAEQSRAECYKEINVQKKEVYPFWNLEDIKGMVDSFTNHKLWHWRLAFMFGLLMGRRVSDTLDMDWCDLYEKNGDRKTHLLINEGKTGKGTYVLIPDLIWSEVLMLSWAVMISLCHADMRLPGYLSWNVSFDGADLSAPSRKELVHTSMLCQHFKRRDDGTGICLFHSAVMPEAFLIPEEICQ